MSTKQFQKHLPPTGYEQQTSTLAVISLISAIASYLIVPLAGAVAAIISGHIAKSQIKNSNGLLTGDGMATWGIVLGWTNIVVIMVPACFFLLLLALGAVSVPLICVPLISIFF